MCVYIYVHIYMYIYIGDKAFECTVCGKGMARKDKLTIHMRIHTGNAKIVTNIFTHAVCYWEKYIYVYTHPNKLNVPEL